MSVDDLKRAYERLPGKRIKRPVRTVRNPYSGDAKDFVLNFGMHINKRLEETPVSYLTWILDNVTNRPDVVEQVNRYLNGSKENPIPKPEVAGTAIGEEGGDIHFLPYVFPVIQHPLMHCSYHGKSLDKTPLQELEDILEQAPDPKLKDFIACRCCHLYRFFVYNTYRKALKLDLSKLDEEGLL